MIINKFLYCFRWNNNQFLILNIFSCLFFRLLYWSTRFLFVLALESSPIYYLPNLVPSFWLFLVFFWMLWMLVIMHNPCHVPHASRLKTWGTTFTEIFFSVSKKWVRSWSQPFLITNLKTFPKTFLAVSPEKVRKKKKEKLEW